MGSSVNSYWPRYYPNVPLVAKWPNLLLVQTLFTELKHYNITGETILEKYRRKDGLFIFISALAFGYAASGEGCAAQAVGFAVCVCVSLFQPRCNQNPINRNTTSYKNSVLDFQERAKHDPGLSIFN